MKPGTLVTTADKHNAGSVMAWGVPGRIATYRSVDPTWLMLVVTSKRDDGFDLTHLLVVMPDGALLWMFGEECTEVRPT